MYNILAQLICYLKQGRANKRVPLLPGTVFIQLGNVFCLRKVFWLPTISSSSGCQVETASRYGLPSTADRAAAKGILASNNNKAE